MRRIGSQPAIDEDSRPPAAATMPPGVGTGPERAVHPIAGPAFLSAAEAHTVHLALDADERAPAGIQSKHCGAGDISGGAAAPA